MYEKYSTGKLKRNWPFMLSDMAGYQISLLIAFFCRNGLMNPFADNAYLKLAGLLLLFSALVSWFIEGYQGIGRRGVLMEFRSVLKSDTVTIMIMIIILFLVKVSSVYSRIVVVLTWALALAVLTIMRSALKRVMADVSVKLASDRRLVLVTTSAAVQETVRRMSAPETADYVYAGAIELDISGIRNALDYLNSNVVDSIFVEESAQPFFTQQMMDMCLEMGLTVHMELKNMSGMRNQTVEKVGDIIVSTSSMRIVTSGQMVAKRLMDIVGSLVGSAAALLIMLVFTPVIKIQNPGPVIFRQKRVGKGGRIFTIYKIRTMYTDAEERKKELLDRNKMQGLMFKVDDDPRIYPFGHFLRKTSLDEFPQFFNVLKGDMSLVGTRPPTVEEYEQYEYRHKKRLSIKPGITGLWQVSGRNKITDFEDVVRLDAEYITDWRLLLDVKILLKTVGAVFRGGGAQ